MATVTYNTVSAFIIRELGGDGRTLQLVGRALPYRPFELSTRQRVDITWYPGNPEATSTVLGSAEEPTQINGYWKDKFISSTETVGAFDLHSDSPTTQTNVAPITLDNEPVDNVRAAVVVFDDFVRQGQLLEVTWDEQARVGHMTQFTKRFHTTHDVEWEIRFEWISRGELTGPAVISQETSISDTMGTIERQATELAQQVVPPFPTTPDVQVELTVLMNTMLGSVKAVQGAVSALATASTTPFDAARRTIAVCTGLVSQTDALYEFFVEHVPGYFDSSVEVSVQTFGETIVAATYVRASMLKIARLRRTAIERRNGLMSYIVSDLLGTYRARDNDNLRDVAQAFYGTPHEWKRLLFFNELTTPVLSAGQIVLIPKIASGGRQ